jgi:mannose-6-phosphate isomerase-like protein (cupin superfamily)
MSLVVNRASVEAEEHPFVSVFRHFRRDSPNGVGVGMAIWKRPPPGFDPEEASEAHDVPEVHYVIRGTGILFEDGRELAIRDGDAILTPAGHRHVMWSTGEVPLTTVYVAVGPGAFESGSPKSDL